MIMTIVQTTTRFLLHSSSSSSSRSSSSCSISSSSLSVSSCSLIRSIVAVPMIQTIQTQHFSNLTVQPQPTTSTSPALFGTSPKKGSHVPSFFTYTSGRARRKRKLRLLQAKLIEKRRNNNNGHNETDNSSNNSTYYYETENDTRTISDILFPNPFKGLPDPNQTKWPTTFTKWKTVLTLAWQDYKETWEGFFTNKGMFENDTNDNDDSSSEKEKKSKTSSLPAAKASASKEKDKDNQDDDLDMEASTKDVMRNMRRNRRFVQVTAMKIREEVRTRTGITSVDDIKQYAADAMRLITECLQQFMSGYRKGRDDEVEKMFTEYFQEMEKKVTTNPPNISKKRRKTQRRILNRYHPLNR